MGWHGYLQQSVEASQRLYSGMTTRSSAGERFPLDKPETSEIKSFYDIGRCTPSDTQCETALSSVLEIELVERNQAFI